MEFRKMLMITVYAEQKNELLFKMNWKKEQNTKVEMLSKMSEMKEWIQFDWTLLEDRIDRLSLHPHSTEHSEWSLQNIDT